MQTGDHGARQTFSLFALHSLQKEIQRDPYKYRFPLVYCFMRR
jgi:hypothetical protein